MDTDDLSREAYEAILVEAEQLSHNLTLHFGVLSGQCDDETEYIDKSIQLVNNIKKLNELGLDDFFFGEVPEIAKLNITLDKILSNIEEVQKIDLDKRHFDF